MSEPNHGTCDIYPIMSHKSIDLNFYFFCIMYLFYVMCWPVAVLVCDIELLVDDDSEVVAVVLVSIASAAALAGSGAGGAGWYMIKRRIYLEFYSIRFFFCETWVGFEKNGEKFNDFLASARQSAAQSIHHSNRQI